MVRRIVREALNSHLDEVIVVVGFKADSVRQALARLQVKIVDNPDYSAGQSTSVKQGLQALNPAASAAIFIPSDQPFLNASLLNRLIKAYKTTSSPIVAPAYQGRRGSPVLFDRSLFKELSSISGDEGGRQILQNREHEIITVALENELPLLDIDTPQDLRYLKE